MKQKIFSQFILLHGEVYKLQTYQLFNLKNLLFYFCYNQNLVVLEYNAKIFPSKNWSIKKLKDSDKIETITIVGGG